MKMPEAIAKAIPKITLEVEGLVKDQDNNFAKYKFVSHDQIKMKAGKLMAKHGLTIVANEAASEVREKALHCEFEFWIYHESGVDYGPIKRTVQVPATGAQAYGTACSYAQKYFLRDIFQIPTGEQEDEGVLPKTAELINIKPKQKPPLTEDSSAKVKEEMLKGLQLCNTLADLATWVSFNSPLKARMTENDQGIVASAYTDTQKNIKSLNVKEA